MISGAGLGRALKLPPQPRVLVITLRRLGDVLLTTPLLRALRLAYPDARIDMLVFKGSEGILAGNPDIAQVIAIPQRPGLFESLMLFRQFWQRYDLAVSTQPGDRPTLMASISGRRRIGLVPKAEVGWKHFVMSACADADVTRHRVSELMQLARLLGIEDTPDIVVPRSDKPLPQREPYAVLHANPLYRIRRWTDAGWLALAAKLRERGLSIVTTGGATPAERAYLDQLWNSITPKVERLDGKLDWGQLAQLLSAAALYVGPDTSVTHLAAASGCPTVAIYGPASPVNMGPWPVGGLREPWARAGSIQRRGNVWVVQNPSLPCMPCDRLGCDNHLESRSECLDTLSVAAVMRAVDRALAKTSKAAAPVKKQNATRPGAA